MEKIDEIGLLESGAQIVAYPNDILDSNRFVITGTSEGIGATLIETDGLALSDMGLSFVSIPVQIIQENPVHQFITPDCQSETTIYLDQSQLAFLQSGQLLLTENGLLTPVIDQQTIDKNHILLSSIGESIKPINVVTSNGLNTLDLSCLEASGDLLLEGSVGLEQRLATIDEQPQPPSSEDLVISGDSTAVNQEINLSELPPLKDPNSKDILPPLRKGPFKCEICFKEFSQHSKYRKHNQFHLEDKPHKCSVCNASFNILSNLTLHKATHQVDRLECPECHKVFSRFASLKAHIMLHEREESLFCTECGDEFGNQVQLDKHIKSHDAEWVKPAARIYKCSSCDKQYSRASVLRQHMKDHFKVKATLSANSYNRAIKRGRMMHSCEVCSKSFQKPSQLIRHNRIHTGEKPFKCDFENCTRSFNQKGSLLIHMMSKHKGLRPFQCQFCSATFSQKGNLRAHVVRLHSIPNTQETVYQCSECSCVFRKLGSLNAHTNRMHPPTPVDHLPVGQKPIDKDNLKLKTQLSPSSKDTSDKENESQENKVSVDFSVQRIITVSNKHEDGTIKQTLMKQRQVGAIKWHQCQACGKEFKKPSDLVRHTRIHTHEKPFQCKSCPRAFSVRSTLVAHTRTHSRQGWDAGKRRLPNPHKCHTCDKNFVSGSALKHHNKTHHNAELNGRNERNAEPILDETYDATGVPAVAPTSAADSTATDSMAATTSDQVPEIDYSQPLLITEQGVVQVVALKEPTRVPVTSEETWDRPHRCAICSLSYRRSNHLKVHMRSHSGERPFTCSVCKRSFKSSGVLKGHLRTHSMLKTHRCHECGKYLSTKGSLLRHRETHSTGLPYKCAYCPRTYKSHATCRKHILTHKGSLVWKSPELNLVEELEEQEYVDTAEGDLEPDDPPEPQGLPEPETGPLPSMPNIDTLIINNPKDMRLQPNTVFASTEPLIISRVDGVSEVALSHTLHADASGTITLPALSGQDGLTQESIRDLEESLNQQLFGSSVSELSLDKEQVVLFDHSFDPCHFPTITLQGDQLEIGQALTSANLAAILPTTEGTATIAEESFSCDHCGGEFSSEADLDKHTLAHIQAPTHTISLQDPSIQIEESISTIHLTSIQAEDVTELRCEVCQERAESAEDLSEHRKTHPSCDICDKAFATTAQHKAHIKSHGREKEFVCEHCGSSFRQLYSLVRHMSIHTPRERNFPCTICGQAFKALGQLRRHEKAEHRESAARRRRRGDVRQLTEEEATQLAASEPTSVSEQVLKASIAERGRISDVQDPDSVKSDVQHANRCKYCPKSFRKPSDLVRHMRIHTGERPFQCDSCNKCFTVKSTLDSHIKTHNTPKPCVCHVCGFNFATKGSLKVHMRLHTGSRPFRCPVCYQRFRTSGHRKAHLMMHVREAQQTLPDPPSAPSLLPTAASDDVTVVEIDHDVFSALLPQYQCNMCHKVFGKQSVLSRHLRIHTGEKPFQCETCQKCFTQKNSLLIHMRIHSGEREWACGECGAAFTQKCNLVAHSRRHHPPEPLAYTIDLSEDKFPVDLEKVVSDLFPHMRPAKATVDL